jgi:hypothetical protein
MNGGTMSTTPSREFLRDWFKHWWGLMGCAVFTFLAIYAAATNKSNAWVVGASSAVGLVMFFVASYQAWRRQHDASEGLQEKVDHLEAAVFGGEPLIDPSTMRIVQQWISFSDQSSNQKCCLHLVVDNLPVNASAIHLEFTWAFGQILANITEAKYHNTIEARENARQITYERIGPYGCLLKLPCRPAENSWLRVHIYADVNIAVRSMRAVFAQDGSSPSTLPVGRSPR